MSSSFSVEGSVTPEPDVRVWDPGRRPEMVPNEHLCQLVYMAMVSQVSDEMDSNSMLRTELNTHANMAVVGRHCYVIHWTGRNVDVSPFIPDYKALSQVPVVDAVILYKCSISGTEYLLVIWNAL